MTGPKLMASGQLVLRPTDPSWLHATRCQLDALGLSLGKLAHHSQRDPEWETEEEWPPQNTCMWRVLLKDLEVPRVLWKIRCLSDSLMPCHTLIDVLGLSEEEVLQAASRPSAFVTEWSEKFRRIRYNHQRAELGTWSKGLANRLDPRSIPLLLGPGLPSG